MTPARDRLDAELVRRGLADSRSRAQALIMAGRVLVAGAAVTKAGAPVAAGQPIELVAPPRYVSRGGEKLETGLRALDVDVRGARCLDAGAAAGGFTDCLLQHGAAHVIAVDVGRAQLHERLRADARVTVIEGTNARYLEPAGLPYRPDVLTADLSFISLRLVLPALVRCAAPEWRALVLVKPQFEAGRAQVRKGVVRDPAVRADAVRRVAACAEELGGAVLGVCDSLHPGPAGNREYLLSLAATGHPSSRWRRERDVDRAIDEAVAGG